MATYDIDPQLSSLAHMKPPFNRASVMASELVLGPLINKERSDERVSVARVDVPARDGATVRTVLYTPASASDFVTASPASESPLPCLLYIHGGAFAMRGAGYHYQLARIYAERLGCLVLYVDYRLAPANPFPVPLYDCLDALAWLLGRSATLVEKTAEPDGKAAAPEAPKVDPARIAIGGDSAGGALAASLVYAARDELGFSPCAQMLVYPMADLHAHGESMELYVDTPMFNARQAPTSWGFYLGKDGSRTPQAQRLLDEHPEYAWPAAAAENPTGPGRRNLMEGLPPAYVETCEFDCLHDEGLAYARALEAAGVDVDLNETHRTVHGYDFILGCDLTRDAIARRCAFLRRWMGTGEQP